MLWDAPLFLGGPVLSWELLRAQRHKWLIVPMALYLGWQGLGYLVYLGDFAAPFRPSGEHAGLRRQLHASLDAERRMLASSDYVSFQLRQLMLLLVLAIPAAVGSRLSQEKERNTLLALLGTELTSRSILNGKLLGAPAWLARLALLGLPPLLAAAGYAEIPLSRILLAFAIIAAFGYFLAAAALLAATLTKHTYETIIGSYALLTIVFLALSFLTEEITLPLWLHPIEFFHRASQLSLPPPPALVLGCFFAFWLGFGVVFLRLAGRLLRPLYLKQAEGPVRVWTWRWRPGPGDDPVCWREQHLIGVGPLPVLRRVPTPLALLSVFLFPCIFIAAETPHLLGRGFFSTLARADPSEILGRLGSLDQTHGLQDIAILGVLLLFLTVATVAVRCVTSISDEKRRKTWEDLIITPLPLLEIIASKRRGIVRAAMPYVIAYVLPMLLLGCFSGLAGVPLALGFAAAAVGAAFATAAIAMDIVQSNELEKKAWGYHDQIPWPVGVRRPVHRPPRRQR